jgi:iron complex transport system substrate-binding protein
MKRTALILLSLLVITIVALPCEAGLSVTDDMGTSVTLTTTPERIISLSPSNTEILFALGLGDRVAGVTEYCNFPPEALKKPNIGGYSTVNIEKVLAQDPDLIVAAYGNGDESVTSLRDLGLTVIALNPKTIGDVLHDITVIGEATGTQATAADLVRNLTERVDRVKEAGRSTGEHPRVAHVIWHDPVYISGNNTFQDEMIRTAGGTNAFSMLEGWKNTGVEDFIRADPEVIIVNSGSGMTGGEDSVARFFRTEPRFQEVSAVRNNRIFVVDADVVDRAGPRIVDALELFATAIHPGLNNTVVPEAGHQEPQHSPGPDGITVGLAALAGLLAMRKAVG